MIELSHHSGWVGVKTFAQNVLLPLADRKMQLCHGLSVWGILSSWIISSVGDDFQLHTKQSKLDGGHNEEHINFTCREQCGHYCRVKGFSFSLCVLVFMYWSDDFVAILWKLLVAFCGKYVQGFPQYFHKVLTKTYFIGRYISYINCSSHTGLIFFTHYVK